MVPIGLYLHFLLSVRSKYYPPIGLYLPLIIFFCISVCLCLYYIQIFSICQLYFQIIYFFSLFCIYYSPFTHNLRKKTVNKFRPLTSESIHCLIPIFLSIFYTRRIRKISANNNQFARNRRIICQYPIPFNPYSCTNVNFASMLLTSSNQTS